MFLWRIFWKLITYGLIKIDRLDIILVVICITQYTCIRNIQLRLQRKDYRQLLKDRH